MAASPLKRANRFAGYHAGGSFGHRCRPARFIVDGQNNSALSTFGGIVQVPYGPFELGVSMFKLYVDGKLIASKDLPYLVSQRALARFGPDF